MGLHDPMDQFKHNFDNACMKMKTGVIIGADTTLTPGEAKAVISALSVMVQEQKNQGRHNRGLGGGKADA